MTNILPISIQATNTNALDNGYTHRLNMIGVKQLLIDLENETDLKKLSLHLQQFGIPSNLIPDNITTSQFKALLQRILMIYRLSGTVKSIELLAIATGATSVVTHLNTFELRYNGKEVHKYYQHNKGMNFKKFAVDVVVAGVPILLRESYSKTFNELFYLFQPINIHLNDLRFEKMYLFGGGVAKYVLKHSQY